MNRIEVREVKEDTNAKRCRFAFKTKTKEVIITPSQVNKMLEQDFNESVEERSFSYEDRKFVDIVSKGIHKNEHCHYEIPLPLKDATHKLPNNRVQAVHRLHNLKRKMENDLHYKTDYVAFMNDIIRNGYAKRVDEED